MWEKLGAGFRKEHRRCTQRNPDRKVGELHGDENIQSADIGVLQTLWKFSKRNTSNPTREQLIRYVICQRENFQPISLYVTQCIEKDSKVREGDFLSFYRRSVQAPERFISAFQPKGWDPLRSIIQELPPNIPVTMFLGDMDFYTLDRCPAWCPERLSQIAQECENLQVKVQAQADRFFGNGRVEVRLWSREYTLDDVRQELEAVTTNSSWRTPEIEAASMRQYQLWGYGRLASQNGISNEQLHSFRKEGEKLTRATYRIEANKVLAWRGIQCWTEPGDPMTVSNYNGKGLPPSLLLTD